ncbi:MAG: tetratricopeptide repeat protein [Muribaculaceae bacterium]|jgi:tetratricopeptide (TPR) repeat protein|nr:tetratricopeptide repeat protein [Muribaculaceae bacterium]MEE1338256.1 tetratricopeptide repeat protein [Muribaculaceae bacterium]
MAKKENETRTSIDELNESLSGIEKKVEENKKMIVWVLGAIVAIAVIILGYVYLIQEPNFENAKTEIAQADSKLALGQDSIALEAYKAVADSYSNDAANRAGLNAGIILFQQGKYEEAINYINKFDAEGVLVGPASQSLIGDCYVNLEKYDEAVKYFDKAISLAGDNDLYTPLFILKKATVLREQGKFAEEAKALEIIKNKYPNFVTGYRVDVDKLIERANAQAK